MDTDIEQILKHIYRLMNLKILYYTQMKVSKWLKKKLKKNLMTDEMIIEKLHIETVDRLIILLNFKIKAFTVLEELSTLKWATWIPVHKS